MEDGIMDTRVAWLPMRRMGKGSPLWMVLGAMTMVPINGMDRRSGVSLEMGIVRVGP